MDLRQHPLKVFLAESAWVDEDTQKLVERLDSTAEIRKALLEAGVLSSGELRRLEALLYGMEHSQEDHRFNYEHAAQLPYALSRRHRVLCIGSGATGVRLATDQPSVAAVVYDALSERVDTLVHIDNSDCERLLRDYQAYLANNIDMRIIQQAQRVRTREDFGTTHIPLDYAREIAEDISSLKLLRHILEYASIEGSSRVSLQPTTSKLEVYYTTQGKRHHLVALPHAVAEALYLKLRYMGDRSLEPCSIRESVVVSGLVATKSEHLYRADFIPQANGITIILTDSLEGKDAIALAKAGIHNREQACILEQYNRKRGLIVVSGISQAGKTFTLYHLLEALAARGSTASLEQDIEYLVEGVDQTLYSRRSDKDIRDLARVYDAVACRPLLQDCSYQAYEISKRRLVVAEALQGVVALVTLLQKRGVNREELARADILNVVSYRFPRLEEATDSYTLTSRDANTLSEHCSIRECIELFTEQGIDIGQPSSWAGLDWRVAKRKHTNGWLNLKQAVHKVTHTPRYEYVRGVVDIARAIGRVSNEANMLLHLEHEIKHEQRKSLLRPALVAAHLGQIDIRDVVTMLRA